MEEAQDTFSGCSLAELNVISHLHQLEWSNPVLQPLIKAWLSSDCRLTELRTQAFKLFPFPKPHSPFSAKLKLSLPVWECNPIKISLCR